MSTQNLHSILLNILSQWPKSGEDPAEARTRLSEDLTDDFATVDLANAAHTSYTIVSRILITGSVAKALVFDASDLNSPNLAVLVRDDRNRWRLQSFKFQCASCFGTGVLNDEPCNVCGATGWGIADGRFED